MKYLTKEKWKTEYVRLRDKTDKFPIKGRKCTLEELQQIYEQTYNEREEMIKVLNSPVGPEGEARLVHEKWIFIWECYLKDILKKIDKGDYRKPFTEEERKQNIAHEWTLKENREYLLKLREMYKNSTSKEMKDLIKEHAESHKQFMLEKFSTL